MYERKETEAIMQRVGRVRRSAGLSQAEFAKALNVPVWQTIIAESGIIFHHDQGRLVIMEELFSGEEFPVLLRKISRKYGVPMDWLRHGKGEVNLRAMPMPDDELTLYFPVVISCQTLLDEVKRLVDLLQLHCLSVTERRAVEQEIMSDLFLKYKAYRACLKQMGKPEIALDATKQLLDFCNQK